MLIKPFLLFFPFFNGEINYELQSQPDSITYATSDSVIYKINDKSDSVNLPFTSIYMSKKYLDSICEEKIIYDSLLYKMFLKADSGVISTGEYFYFRDMNNLPDTIDLFIIHFYNYDTVLIAGKKYEIFTFGVWSDSITNFFTIFAYIKSNYIAAFTDKNRLMNETEDYYIYHLSDYQGLGNEINFHQFDAITENVIYGQSILNRKIRK